MPDRRQRKRRKALQSGLGLVLGAGAGLVLLILPGVPGWAAALTVAVGLVAALRALNDRGGVPVIVYHSVSAAPEWLPWAANTSVRPEVFKAHLRVLRRGGWQVIPSQELVRARQEGRTLPRRVVALHFDDAYLDNHVAAMPILRHHGMPATVFASTDFIDPSTGLRPVMDAGQGVRWDGYMNADELRAMDADPLFEIACHGTDHARVAVGPPHAERLSKRNWKRHAPWLWGQMPGNKARWYEADAPPLPLGTPVPQTDAALCAGCWDAETGHEPDVARRARILDNLRRARAGLGAILGREVTFLCWPFDRVTPEALELAREAGFTLFTGGRDQNCPGEDPTVLSRTHVNDHAAGPGMPLWVEALVFRARLGVAAGQLWWLPITWAAARRRAKTYAIEYETPAGSASGGLAE